MRTLLNLPYTAQGAIPRYSVVRHGTADGTVVQATAAADLVIGVNSNEYDLASGETGPIVVAGEAQARCGAAVTRGQRLIADASGRVIPAAAAAGTNVNTVGYAQQSGVLGDVIDIVVVPGVFQG